LLLSATHYIFDTKDVSKEAGISSVFLGFFHPKIASNETHSQNLMKKLFAIQRLLFLVAIATVWTTSCSRNSDDEISRNALQTDKARPAVESESPVEIPFELTEHNNISIDAVLNEKHELVLMFHTAVDEVSIVQNTLEKLPDIKLDLEANVESWGGGSKTCFGRGFKLSLGPVQLDNVTIFQSKFSGHQTEGKFGPRQFKSQFVEVDFTRSRFLLHQTVPKKTSGWERVAVTAENGMMFIDGNIHDGEDLIEQRFLIHSGYSSFALLDDEFVAKHTYVDELEIIDESKLTDSSGNTLKTKKALLPRFSIGSIEFDNVPVSFFSGAIGRQKISMLGGDFLKRFDLVFDLENNALYLTKSQHFNAEHS